MEKLIFQPMPPPKTHVTLSHLKKALTSPPKTFQIDCSDIPQATENALCPFDFCASLFSSLPTIPGLTSQCLRFARLVLFSQK